MSLLTGRNPLFPSILTRVNLPQTIALIQTHIDLKTYHTHLVNKQFYSEILMHLLNLQTLAKTASSQTISNTIIPLQ